MTDTDTETPSLKNIDVFGGKTVQQVERDRTGQLVVRLDETEEPFVNAQVLRCFPWSLPDEYISIRDADEKELVLLRSLDELDEDSRRIVREELEDKMFSPKIQKVLSFKHEFGVASVRALTDRGEVTFQIRSRDDVRLLSPTRALFRDADGNTYELPDLDLLDPPSQKKLQHYF